MLACGVASVVANVTLTYSHKPELFNALYSIGIHRENKKLWKTSLKPKNNKWVWVTVVYLLSFNLHSKQNLAGCLPARLIYIAPTLCGQI